MRVGIVIKDYTTRFNNPIKLHMGDRVKLGKKDDHWQDWVWCSLPDGNEGWVPEKIIQIKNSEGIILSNYDATELSVKKKERLELFHEEGEWVWSRNELGKEGWVPMENVEIKDEY